MKLIDKYLSRSILAPTIAIIAILSFIVLITQSLKYVDLIVSYGANASDFIYVTILLLPSLISIIIPICFFIALIYSLNKLSAHRELNILKSVGIDDFSIARPILKVALLVTIAHYILSLYLTPIVNHHFKELTKDLKENYITFFLQERVFNHPTKFLTFYINNKISDTKFKQIFYQDSKNPQNPITFIAQEGELLKKNNKIFLNLIKGNRQELNAKDELTILNFDSLLVQLDFSKNSNIIRKLTIQEKNIFELLSPPLSLNSEEKNRMYSEATHRLTWPLYNIILTMLAISIFLRGEFNRIGKTKKIIYYSIMAGIIVIINNSLVNLSATYNYLIILSYLFTFGILGLLIYILFYQQKYDLQKSQ